MKKALYALAAIVVLLVGAALLVPSFLDRGYYVNEVQTRVKAMTGRDLTIAGKVDLTLLPQPTVLVEDIRLSNVEGAAVPDMVTLKSLQVRVAILPLLAGRLEIASLALNRPVVELETLSDGRHNWRFAALTEADSVAPGKGEAAGEAEGAGLIKLDRLLITDGVIVYRDSQSGMLERVNDLDAEISVRSPKGPILATGAALPRGVPMRFDVSIGEIEPQKPIAVGVTLAIEPGASRLEFKADVSQADAGAITGRVHAEAGDLGKLLHAMFGETGVPLGLAQRFALNGTVAASAQRVNVSDIEIALGDSHATGSIESILTKPARTAIKVVADRIDLDPLLEARSAPATANAGAKPTAPAKEPAAASAKPGAAPPGKADGGFALPADLAGSVDILAKTVVYRQGEVHDAHVIAQLAGGQLTLQRAMARLPGQGTVAFTGAMTTRNAMPRFDGGVDFSANNPRALLSWLGADLESLPADRLKKLSLSSRVAVNADEAQLRDMQLAFDSTRVTGAVTLALRARPAFGANIAIDRLDLGAYLPPAGTRQADASGASDSAGAKPNQGKPGEGGMAALSPLERFDANLHARVAQLSYKSTQMQGLALDGTLHDGVLTLKELSVQDLAGAQGKVSGVLSGFSGTPQVKAALDFRSNDLPRILKLAGVSVPGAAEKLGKVSLSGSANTSGQDVIVDLGLGVWNGTARAKGRLDDLATNPKYDLDFALDFPDAAIVMRTFAPETQSGKLGAFKLAGKATGDMTNVALTGLKGNLGPSSLAGEISATLAQPRPKYTIALTTGELPLAALGVAGGTKPQAAPAVAPGKGGAAAPKRSAERWSRDRIDLASLKSFDAELRLQSSALRMEKYSIVNATVEAIVADGALELRKLTGKLFDGALDAKAKLNAEGGTTAEISLDQFDVDQALKGLADLDRASGRATFKSALRGAAKSEYELVSTLAGQGSIDGNVTVRVKGKELGGAAALGLLASQMKGLQGFAGATGALLSAFGSAPATLKGTFTAEKGVIRTNDLRMDSAQGTALVTGNVNLPPYTVDGQGKVSLKSSPNQPILTVAATGSLDQPDLKVGGSAIQGAKPTVPGIIEQIVPGVGGQKPLSTPQPQPQKKPQSPKDQLKGILKGLGG